MEDWEIGDCNKVTCIYADDIGSFKGEFIWDDSPAELYLHCDPDDSKERLIVKLAFEAIFHEKDRWQKLAVDFASGRFIPYYRHVSGSTDDNLEEILPKFLVPCAIELGADGVIVIALQSFKIGRRSSYLDVTGTVGGGFAILQDNGIDVPIVSDSCCFPFWGKARLLS